MTFNIFGIDLYPKDRVAGWWLFTFKDSEKQIHRSMFELYYNDGEIFVDLFWMNFKFYV